MFLCEASTDWVQCGVWQPGGVLTMRRCLALLAICAIACVGVSADVIFSNFGTGDSFNLSMA